MSPHYEKMHDNQIHNERNHYKSPPFGAVEPSAVWSYYPSPPAGVEEGDYHDEEHNAADCQPQRLSSLPWSQPSIKSAENENSNSAVREIWYAGDGSASSPRTNSSSYCSSQHHHHHHQQVVHHGHQEMVPNAPHSSHENHIVWHCQAQQWNNVHHPHSYHQDAMQYKPYYCCDNNSSYHPPHHHHLHHQQDAPSHDTCRNFWLPQQSTRRKYSVAYPSSVKSSAPPAKKRKRVKVAHEPRRPLSAYNFFFSEEKGVVVALLPEPPASTSDSESTKLGITDHPKNIDGMSVEQIEEILEETMTQMSPIEIKTIRQNIETETQVILDAHLEGDREKKSHKKKHGKISFQKLASVIGNRWRRLSTDGKKRYFELAKVDKERFKKLEGVE